MPREYLCVFVEHSEKMEVLHRANAASAFKRYMGESSGKTGLDIIQNFRPHLGVNSNLWACDPCIDQARCNTSFHPFGPWALGLFAIET